MKMLKTMTALIAAVAMACGFASCSKDDDGGSGDFEGNAQVTLGDQNLGTNYAFYSIDDESTAPEGMHYIMIDFCNFDMLSAYEAKDPSHFPEKLNMITIDYAVPVSQTDIRSIVLPAGDYHVYVVKDMPVKTGGSGWQGENDEYAPGNDSQLTIVKDGDKYTVTFKAKIHSHAVGSEQMDFSFSGPITLAPAGMFE